MGGEPIDDYHYIFDSTAFYEKVDKLLKEQMACPIEDEKHETFRRFWLAQWVRKEE